MHLLIIISGVVFGCVAVCDSAAAQQTSADAVVTIVSPAEISTQQATQLLFSPTPGVLTITIPGASGPFSTELTASGVDSSGSKFTFTASGSDAAALTQLMEQLASGVASGSFSSGLTVSGFINGQGVQITILHAAGAEGGGGIIKATITFD